MKGQNEKGEFLLIFDIPRELNTLKVQVWRELNRKNAEKVQFSIWKSNNLKELVKIASLIKRLGGKASILEEKFIFE